jgi:hypothetical protein
MTYPRELSETEFRRSYADPMRDMTKAQQAAADIWPYVDLLTPQSVGVARIGDVALVSRDADSRYDHVLLDTGMENTFLVIVVDLGARAVLGHHLLDLNIKYGLATEQ